MHFSTLTRPVAVSLAAFLFAGPATAQCPSPDFYEPNDTCATASTLTLGLTGTLAINLVQDMDYWTYTMAAGELLTIDVLFSDAAGDLDAVLYGDATCLSQLDQSVSISDNEHITYYNGTGAPRTVTLRVYPFSIPACTDYALQVFSVIGPCAILPDDAFESNDNCAAAAALTDGTYLNLFTIKNFSDDYFKVDVEDGETLNVYVNFQDSLGDIDCYLYDSSTLGSTCGNNIAYLDRGISVFDNERMDWTNSTGVTQTYYIEIHLWSANMGPGCASYDLVIDVRPPSFATDVCLGDGTTGPCPCFNESTLGAGEGCKNSQNVGAILTASGTNSVAADDIAFTVEQARPSQTTILLQGSSLIALPFKDGLLCLGNPTERVETMFLDGSGSATTSGSIVTNGEVVVGHTRWYQMWFRDPGSIGACGSGSNLSQGLMVTYTP